MSHNTAAFGAPRWHSVAALAAPSRHGLVCVSAAMRDLADALERLAPYRCPVLIAGESGSGKEAVAEALHKLGPHREGPLIKFNCGSIAGDCATMQLFGAVERVFGGWPATSPGCFQFAQGGSLLLGDVDELPLWLQGKLLRAVENLEIQPIGSDTTLQMDVRLIPTTKRDLAAMVKTGGFRPDLYYRLAGASLRMPPLRNRTADLEPLTADLIAHYNRSFGKHVTAISSAAIAHVLAYQWPGNLREMAHALERAILMCDNGRIDVCDLPPAVIEAAESTQSQQPSARLLERGRLAGSFEPRLPVSMTAGLLDHALKEAVERSLKAAQGDYGRAAAMLGVSRGVLYYKMIRFGLTKPLSQHETNVPGAWTE